MLVKLILFLSISIILSSKIIDVQYIDQTEKYPTGCESVSTVMCIKYHGINITVENFIDKYLEKAKMIEVGGKLYAPDPFKKFIGSPYNSHSYGCYGPVIEKALNKMLKDLGLTDKFETRNLNDVPVKELIDNYINNDIPVIFWATIDLKPSYNGTKWIILPEKREYTWRAREHCMLLVGYDYEKKLYYFNDPWDNHGLIGYDMELVEKRHKEQFSNAVALLKKK